MTALPFRRGGRRTDRGGRFLIPLVIVMGLTSLYPMFYSIYMSFFDWNWGERFNFIGLGNYIELAGSERFHIALVNTFVFTVGAVGVELVLGLGLALVVNRLGRGRTGIGPHLFAPVDRSAIAEFLQIEPGTEGAAGTGQNHHPGFSIGFQCGEGLKQSAAQVQ